MPRRAVPPPVAPRVARTVRGRVARAFVPRVARSGTDPYVNTHAHDHTRARA
ncbi:hypothetical protein [Streptomyces sp. CBMA29]|uniref:hypothetical protein n=1 Tax=Streptomyces sp. CBMA29 TaxID=1896314 RepID=UPI001661FD4C|nr:hypothetical protein [Streptomyces sp. CBMA29]